MTYHWLVSALGCGAAIVLYDGAPVLKSATGYDVTLSAGAPVAPHQFDWLYEAVKRDMIFASISGGTEIIGLADPSRARRPVDLQGTRSGR
jgi:acetoacetyl-CoA synthetase